MHERIEERKQNPRKDDLISYLLTQKVDGEPVPEAHVLGTCFLLMVAGIDTTWSSIGSALWHLAQHPGRPQAASSTSRTLHVQRHRRAAAGLLAGHDGPRTSRETRSTAACPMHEGDKVLMNFPAANRDPRVFENPDKVILDREKNPHIAFGVGIHRCAGSNLARMEMKVAIEEFLKRIPDFRLEAPTR